MTAKLPFAWKQDNGETMNAPTHNAWLESVADEAEDQAAEKAKAVKIEREVHKLEKRLCRQVGQAISEFNMIEEGDRIMVCMSGGKDSYGMLDILLKMKQRAPGRFRVDCRQFGPKAARLSCRNFAHLFEKHGHPVSH
jgi:predicted PP-loop superfamily ATPase